MATVVSIVWITFVLQVDAAKKSKPEFWVWWVGSDTTQTEAQLKVVFHKYRECGFKGIFFGRDSEKFFRAAKSEGIEAQYWTAIMNRGEEMKDHPEWYAVSRKGESVVDKPPYVNYYRWLCPSRSEVIDYLKKMVDEKLSKKYIDGINLDYIRYCDVILPVDLWKHYNIVQTSELPEYDFCYCDSCKAKFKAEYHQDIDSIEYPQESLSWRQFRYDQITNVVNQLAKIAKKHHKSITADVFPTPEVAKRIVRQDWVNWNLTAVFPMIYNSFYREPVSWIGTATQEGVNALHGRFPLFAGVYLPDLKTKEDVRVAIDKAMANGAKGVCYFGTMTDMILDVSAEYK